MEACKREKWDNNFKTTYSFSKKVKEAFILWTLFTFLKFSSSLLSEYIVSESSALAGESFWILF